MLHPHLGKFTRVVSWKEPLATASPSPFSIFITFGIEIRQINKELLSSYSADQDLKTMLMNNTIVTGGTTLLKGFTKRLESELASLEDHTGHIKLKCANNPVTATWNGASVISSLSTFSQQCITTDQYAEIGSQVVHMKCF